MLTVQGVSLQYGGKPLFKDINLTFSAGNCYGIIGANGAGKSTFLKVISGEIEADTGTISLTPNERMAVLQQDHYAFDAYNPVDTVILGHKRLSEIRARKEVLYAKEDMTDAEGLELAELEGEFADLDGWSAESDAETLLTGLGIPPAVFEIPMAQLDGPKKVKVLLAQALFAQPDILLLDEPTNNLDIQAVRWLEDFLLDFPNTVLVVSHDRHFLNKVCTHIVDIDFNRAQLYVGNYDFWYEYTQMVQRQQKDERKRNEQKAKELQEFIQRFSANASKSRQATARKKLLDNLQMDNYMPSSRRYPYIAFQQNREVGNDVLFIRNLTKRIGDRTVLDNLTLTIMPGDKVAFVGDDEVARTTLFQILSGNMEADSGEYAWGVTTSLSYLPVDHTEHFEGVEDSLIEWIRRRTDLQYEADIRGWLGRMLFSGDDAYKKAKVLSGGERVRCMFAWMMIGGANVIILNEPTNHLDLEAITALNEGMVGFKGNMLFATHDRQIIETVANRIVELLPGGVIDRRESFEEYVSNPQVDELRSKLLTP